jgi:hypothetical protein
MTDLPSVSRIRCILRNYVTQLSIGFQSREIIMGFFAFWGKQPLEPPVHDM